MGGGTTGNYKLYSLDLNSYYLPPPITSLPRLYDGDIHRIIDENLKSSIVASISKEVASDSSSFLFPGDSLASSFSVPSIPPSKWLIRKLICTSC